MEPIDIGVIGLGIMGRQHLRILRDSNDFRVIGICEPNLEQAEKLTADDPRLLVVRTIEELVNTGISAAVVASPTAAHAEQAEYLLKCGIHVLIEKPVAADIVEAAHLRELSANSTSCVLVGHVERFNPAVRRLKKLLQEGFLGSIVSISTTRVGVSRPAMPSTNVVLDLAIHDLDIIRFLLDNPVRIVGASGGSFPGNRVEDYAHLLITCGHTAGVVEANWITPHKRRKLFVTGTAGFAELDYIRQEIRTYAGRTEVIGDGSDLYHSVVSTSDPVVVSVARSEPLQIELDHFASCIRGTEYPVITLEEAIDALKCCHYGTWLMRRGRND